MWGAVPCQDEASPHNFPVHSLPCLTSDPWPQHLHRALCGYTHPIFTSAAAGGATAVAPRFTGLPEMRRHIESAFKLSFCDICVNSRKVCMLLLVQGGRGGPKG